MDFLVLDSEKNWRSRKFFWIRKIKSSYKRLFWCILTSHSEKNAACKIYCCFFNVCVGFDVRAISVSSDSNLNWSLMKSLKAKFQIFKMASTLMGQPLQPTRLSFFFLDHSKRDFQAVVRFQVVWIVLNFVALKQRRIFLVEQVKNL